MGDNDLAGDVQPESQPIAVIALRTARLELGEASEDALSLRRRDPRSIVADAYLGMFPGRLKLDLDLLGAGCEDDRVVEQVHQHLGQTVRVSVRDQRLIRQVKRNRLALRDRLGTVSGITNDRPQIDWLIVQHEATGLEAHNIDQIADQRRQLAGLELRYLKLPDGPFINTVAESAPQRISRSRLSPVTV